MTPQQLLLIGAVGVLLVLAYLAGLATMAILVMGRDRDEDSLPPYRGHVPPRPLPTPRSTQR